jgi:hypothetical protein
MTAPAALDDRAHELVVLGAGLDDAPGSSEAVGRS